MTDRALTIFLVEDDEVDVMNVRRAFQKHHIVNPLFVASDGIEALEKLRPSFDHFARSQHHDELSQVLYALGWRNQRVLEEGLPGWHEKGYPVVGTNVSRDPRH